ncbi:MAG: hypothetical protein ACRC6V_02040 [Bacteroidales bacterium]
MTRIQAADLLSALDNYARKVCRYEYGLPTYDNNYEGLPDHMSEMIEIVLYAVNKENTDE